MLWGFLFVSPWQNCLDVKLAPRPWWESKGVLISSMSQTQTSPAAPVKSAASFFAEAFMPAHPSCGVSVRGLACRRGLRPVFENLEFSLESGQALALYGVNGSGKTSLLRQLAGLLPVETGDISALPMHSMHPMRHYLGHADGLKAALTVGETVHFETALRGSDLPTTSLPALLSALGLAGRSDQAVGDLSAGQRRRLSLARLVRAPRPLWLLDEPLTALDADGVALIETLAQAHLAAGGMLIAASHQPLAFATKALDMTLYATGQAS